MGSGLPLKLVSSAIVPAALLLSCHGSDEQPPTGPVPQPGGGGFDFETQPIRALVEDGWVLADGTTLGADDGIGIAMIMAIQQATDLAHGPIEALFTTNEEDGMDGITGLAPDALRGRLYLNVDNEIEGSFVISSAGGINLDVRATRRGDRDRQAGDPLLGAVLDAPQGVYRMSAEVPGLVETSCNLGILAIADGRFTGGALARSAVDSERDAEASRFAQAYEQAGATVEVRGAYASWPPDPGSPLLALMQRVYRETFGAEAKVTAVHAGLETSTAGARFAGMDMISVGATTRDVHSPDERLEVASVPRAYQLLVATLGAVE